MEPNQPDQQQAAPEINPDELKMPEEQFGAEEPARTGGMLIPILVSILIILLIALGALVVWGEEIVNMLRPSDAAAPAVSEEVDTTAAATTTPEPTPADTFAEIESDLESTDFDAIDAELEAIDATLSATTTAE